MDDFELTKENKITNLHPRFTKCGFTTCEVECDGRHYMIEIDTKDMTGILALGYGGLAFYSKMWLRVFEDEENPHVNCRNIMFVYSKQD